MYILQTSTKYPIANKSCVFIIYKDRNSSGASVEATNYWLHYDELVNDYIDKGSTLFQSFKLELIC